jgi:hypothetical protein
MGFGALVAPSDVSLKISHYIPGLIFGLLFLVSRNLPVGNGFSLAKSNFLDVSVLNVT